MRTLLTESLPGCGHDVEAQLRDAGHEVVRCHPPGAPTFPCAALAGTCPLEEPAAIDALVAVRTPTEHDQAISEMGITCALRHRVPVVVVGGGIDPYGDQVWRAEEQDLLPACAAAVEEAAEQSVAPLRDEARRLVERRGLDADEVDVRIRHEGRRTRIIVTVPRGSEDVDELVATRLLAQYEPPAGRRGIIDVHVGRPEEAPG
jgi:hypothetical protein